MEILIFNILKLSPSLVFDLETWDLFYFVENVVFYNKLSDFFKDINLI